jgi:hypothetical protein
MIGTHDEDHYFDCHEAAGEIERLRRFGRLADDEVAAIEFASQVLLDNQCPKVSARLRAMAARLGRSI